MVNSNIDFLIFVEHTARELDIASLIKYCIEQKGSTAEVISLPYCNKNLIKKNYYNVLVVPYCYELGIYQSILALFSNIKVINLAYEQIFQNINENLKAPKDEYSKKYVMYHSWSSNYFDYLIKYGVDPANIAINGNLSYALYKYPYRNYFTSREALANKYNLNPLKKWLFIPENYGAAFYSESIINEKVEKGIDPIDVIKYREFAIKSLKEVINWCVKVLQEQDIEIIFRPRPATPYEKMWRFFTDVLPDIPHGIKIIKSHTVREWILASDLIFSSYSTTLIEAAIAEKPIGMLEPVSFPDYLDSSWYNMVPKIVNYENFAKTIISPSHCSYQSLKRWAETEMMSSGDPIQGIVNLMLSVKENGIAIPEIYTKKYERFAFSNLLYRAFDCCNSLKKMVFVQKSIIIEDYDSDLFTSEDVASRVTRWEKVLNENKLS